MRSLALTLALLLPAVAMAEGSDAGRQLFETRCADVCHDVPALDSLSPKQWRHVLATMQKRMKSAGMDPLTEQELEQLYRYITRHTSP